MSAKDRELLYALTPEGLDDAEVIEHREMKNLARFNMPGALATVCYIALNERFKLRNPQGRTWDLRKVDADGALVGGVRFNVSPDGGFGRAWRLNEDGAPPICDVRSLRRFIAALVDDQR